MVIFVVIYVALTLFHDHSPTAKLRNLMKTDLETITSAATVTTAMTTALR